LTNPVRGAVLPHEEPDVGTRHAAIAALRNRGVTNSGLPTTETKILRFTDAACGGARGTEDRASAERYVHLQAALLKARESAPSLLLLKEPNCDDYLRHRA
jgi:hypothetical protein